MQLEICNLGPFSELSIELPLSGLLSLRGKSGTGKSRLSDILLWVWTGEPRTGIVNKHAKDKDKAWARLTMPSLSIYRQKNPGRREVVTADLVLEDAAADEYLAKEYGSNDLIYASSYLKQYSFHELMASSASDRLKLLQDLVMTSQRPSVYIDKVQVRSRQLASDLEEAEQKVKALDGELKGIKEKDFKVLDQVPEDLEAELKAIREEIAEAEEYMAKYHACKGAVSSLESQLEMFRINEIREVEANEISMLKERKQMYELELKRATTYAAMSKVREKAEALRAQIEKLPVLAEDVNLAALRIQEQNYESSTALFKAMGIEYTEEARKQTVEEMTAAQEQHKLAASYAKLAKLEASITTKPIYEMEDLEKWERQLELLICPHCEAGLRYVNKRLILESGTKPQIPINAEQIKKAKQEYVEYHKNAEALETLKKTLPPYQEPKWKPKQVTRLAELKVAVLTTKPAISVSTAEEGLKRRDLESQMNSLSFSDLPKERVPAEITKDIRRMETQISRLENIKREWERKCEVEADLAEAKIAAAKFTDGATDIEAKIKRRNELEDLLARFRRCAEKRRLWLKREAKRSLIKKLTEEQRMLLNIREVMVAVEYKMLGDIVSGLNVSIAEYLTVLFEKPVSVIIDLFKEVKSTHQKKNQVTLQYACEGIKGDNAAEVFSIGQRVRASIAVLLAFSSMSNLPYVIFDESIASLNDEFREAVREVVRAALPEKLIIMSHHNDTEGDYDYHICLEDLLGEKQ